MPRSFDIARGREAPRPSVTAGLAVLSAGVLFYELVLMRIFSVLMWYHFASLAIGLALLGLGAGGLAVGLYPALGGPRPRPLAAALFGAGVTTALLFLVAVHFQPEFARQTLAPFHQPFYKPFDRPETSQLGWPLVLRLTGLALGAGWPFLFAGAATAGCLAERAPKIGGAYAATFLGAAAGCAAFPFLLDRVSAPAALAVAAALGLASAALFAGTARGRAQYAALALVALLGGAWTERTGAAEIPFARGRYEPDLLAVRWNAMSRVAAYPLPPGDTLRAFGQSGDMNDEGPRQIGLVVDDSGYTNLFEGGPAAANPEYFRANLVAAAHHLRPEGRALLFGPGGGKDVWIALSFPGTRVQAVEINPQVVEMAEEVFAGFTGKPYSRPGVDLAVTDARRFAATDGGRYDVVSASSVFGRLPPAAGAFTLSEDLLHTVDAFEDYWNRLDERGILSITRFSYEQRALRLVAMARALLDREGIADPGSHIRVLTDRGLSNVMLSRSPFTPEDDRILRELCDRYRFEFLYPDPDPANPSLLSRLVDEKDFGKALDAVAFDVSPPTDDRPFFYYTVRPRDFLMGSLPGRAGFDDRGAELLRAAFLVLSALTVLFFIGPVWAARGLPRGRATAGPLLFFTAIGLGYMMLEIGVMKRLFLLLGHPVYAVSATLLAFLVGSGAGSLLAGRLAPNRRALGGWLLLAALLGLFHAFLAPALLRPLLPASAFVRFGAAALVVLPLSFTLGIAFPAATALLGPGARPLLPWAFALNGAASVAASLGAVLLAMNFGYVSAISSGAVLYALAAFLVPGAGKEGVQSPGGADLP